MPEDKGQKKARNRSLVSVKLYQKKFDNPEGKKILWDLMKHSGFMDSPKGDINANDVIFREGQKDIVRYILQKIKTDYKQLEKLVNGGLDDDRESWF
jgi:hypothetical protein